MNFSYQRSNVLHSNNILFVRIIFSIEDILAAGDNLTVYWKTMELLNFEKALMMLVA